ncbi:MAG: hypothetical protein QM765_34700 [Myxococcales bacterium]
MKTTKLTSLTLLFLAAASLSACGAPETITKTEVVRSWFAPATAGGKGGDGGAATVLYAHWTLEEGTLSLPDVFDTRAGNGGGGGKATVGKPGVDGLNGAAGELDTQSAPFVFDATGITPDMVIDSNADAMQLFLEDNADPMPVLKVDRFRIAAGSRLDIGCDVRIEARQFVIEEGGRLVVRGRDSGRCSIGIMQLESRPGLLGGQLFVQADTIELRGTIDVAGNAGQSGEQGGAGGTVLLRTTNLTIHEGAKVLAHGGDGGAGGDEREIR